MKILASGAEAIIIQEKGKVIKDRIKKSYRIPEIDNRLRSTRTKREATIMRKLHTLGFDSPQILHVDPKHGKLEMHFVEGKKVRDILAKGNYKTVCREIGEKIAFLHNNDIIHGDLTTSNMILQKGKVFFIDFGLSYLSERVEDRAVDLHLLRQALESKHCQIWEQAFKECIKAYTAKADNSEEILKRFEVVEMRGRYKQKGS